jgi:hypothetical protein
MPPFDPTSASRAVLIEVMNVLGAFRDELVIVGGWVPDLLYPNAGHMGSLDVDLAVSPRALGANSYETILKRLLDAGYQHVAPPTQFFKLVTGVEKPVKTDLITGQYQDKGKTDAIQVNELRINSLKGIDLAFEACDEIELAGPLPDGTHNVVRARIVRPEAFVLIKAFALDERAKDRDAFDVAFVLQNFQPTIEALAMRLRPHLAGGLALEGYRILQGKFATLDSVGPVWAARVAKDQGADFEQERRSAYENAQDLFRAVDLWD